MNSIGRNAQCPCGSSKKYKRCCLKKVDWENLVKRSFFDRIPFLSLRGRNIAFMGRLLEALQLDDCTNDTSYVSFKKSFTPKAVWQIYEAITVLWPSPEDYRQCMAKEAGATSALYTGSYEPEDVISALSRHALYTERIFLIDPFIDPRRIANDHNPLNYPEQYRSDTIKWCHLWVMLYPWIKAGIVSFIRPPADFVPGMWKTIFERQHERFQTPELKKIADLQVAKSVEEMMAPHGSMAENIILQYPDEYFKDTYNDIPEPKPPLEEWLQHIKQRRDDHPYFVDPLPEQDGQIFVNQTGACYELAKVICSQTNSHVFTNLQTRWKEIELDRPNLTQEMALWSPFAKALQNADLKILRSCSLEAALKLREENRLEGMRLFFRRVWSACKDPDDFTDPNSLNLTAELDERVAEAKAEWKMIDHDLVKWFGVAGSAVVAASAGFLPAATAVGGAAVSGAICLIESQLKRRTLREKFPAAFFLGLKQ